MKEKFDWERLLLSGVMGGGCLGLAALFFWVVDKKGPHGDLPWQGWATAQRMVCHMPEYIKHKMVYLMALGFALFGFFYLGRGAWRVIRFLRSKS